MFILLFVDSHTLSLAPVANYLYLPLLLSLSLSYCLVHCISLSLSMTFELSMPFALSTTFSLAPFLLSHSHTQTLAVST